MGEKKRTEKYVSSASSELYKTKLVMFVYIFSGFIFDAKDNLCSLS